MTALDVQRSFFSRRAEDQTAWPVLVFWVIFDDLATSDYFSPLLHTYPSQDALVNGVPEELELIRFYLYA